MRHRRRIMFGVAMLVLTGCQSSPGAHSPRPGPSASAWKTYTDPQGNFSIQYPTDLHAYDYPGSAGIPQGGTGVLFAMGKVRSHSMQSFLGLPDTSTMKEPQVKVWLQVWEYEEGAGPPPSPRYVAAWFRPLIANGGPNSSPAFAGYRQLVFRPLTVDGKACFQYLYEARTSAHGTSVLGEMETVFAVTPHSFLIVIASGDATDFQHASATINRFVQSLRFTAPGTG